MNICFFSVFTGKSTLFTVLAAAFYFICRSVIKENLVLPYNNYYELNNNNNNNRTFYNIFLLLLSLYV